MVNSILIIGKNGMLGKTLSKTFDRFNLTLWDKDEIDITDADQVNEKIMQLEPDVIINAAAYTAVDDCEEKKNIAMAVNGAGPRNLAAAAKSINAILIHYSTDYIFNGEKPGGYDEDFNEIDPINVYGESKAAGEKGINEVSDDIWNKFYIIRTAWLYGSVGNNFVDTMIKLGKEKDRLSVVNDQHGSPTFTNDLAERTRWMLDHEKAYGIYHVTNSGTCTWYEFAAEIFKQANITVNLSPCTTEEFPRPAKRPAYSILLNTKLPEMRSWQSALKEYLSIE